MCFLFWNLLGREFKSVCIEDNMSFGSAEVLQCKGKKAMLSPVEILILHDFSLALS